MHSLGRWKARLELPQRHLIVEFPYYFHNAVNNIYPASSVFYMGEFTITLLNPPEASAESQNPGFDALFSAHHRQVFRAAYRVTGNLQDAEDILQSVFLRLLAREGQLSARDNNAAYLCRSAINASIDLLRSRARTQHESLVEEEHMATQGEADSIARQEELRQILRNAMLSLDSHTAEVFALRYFEEFSNAEIAVLLDTSPNTIAVTLHRARAHLQEILGEFEGDDQ